LDIKNEKILAVFSSIDSLPKIAVMEYINGKIGWISPNYSPNQSEVQKLISQQDFGVVTYGKFPYHMQYIYRIPKNVQGKVPVILHAHGGPHGSCVTQFTADYEFLCFSGFAVIQINYRGSLGLGKDNLESLLGRIGKNDIDDCVEAMENFFEKFSDRLDTGNLFYVGESHGGFIGAHLAVRLGKKINALVLRNPVINCANHLGVSDIPDWVLVETGSTKLPEPIHDHDHDHSSHDHVHFGHETCGKHDEVFECSPLAHANSITSPILILLGDIDRRVHISQGKQLYFKLKSIGVETSMKMYPNTGHFIDRIDVEADAWINAVLWFRRHLRKEGMVLLKEKTLTLLSPSFNEK